MHGALVGVVVNHLGSQVPLLLFTKTLENVIGAHLHNANFVGEALVLTLLVNTLLVLADFLVATAGDLRWNESHIFRVLHGWGAEATILVSEGLCLTVGVPIVVGLVVSVPLLQGVIEVTIQPVHLGNCTEEEWHLSVFVGLKVVSLTHWVHHLVGVGVDDLVTKVPVWLLPIVLRDIGGVEVDY